MNESALKETFYVDGDAPDPRGSGLRGVEPGYDLTRGAAGHPMLYYALPNGREMILEADVYELPNEPSYIHLHCPMCLMTGKRKQMLCIKQDHKAFAYHAQAAVPAFPGWTDKQMKSAFPKGLGGLLSVEQFRCTWEVEPGLRREFGFAVCPWNVVIERNVVRNV